MTTQEGTTGPGYVLERPRLLRALERALEVRLTLVIAPAGFGKSELLTQWLRQRPDQQIVRLALDERDNDPGRFWQSLVATIATQVPEVSKEPARLAQIVTPAAIDVLVESIVRTLVEADAALVVILDDFHFIDDPTILDSVDLLRDEMPPSLHLVVAGRHDPRLPVSRLRLRGELAELREADLRFTLEETRSLLEGSSIDISHSDSQLLWERTEGWSAALRLAILSMEQSSDAAAVVRDISGTNLLVADYLLEEVISEMPSDREDFLLSTSITEEIDGDLAQELSGRHDAAAMLARLAAEGLFTTPMFGREGWYRYHRLLRDLLRARLRHDASGRFVALHRRAAAWHHKQRNGPASIRHALEAGDIDDAARWLGDVSPGLVARGNAVTVAELSAAVITAAPEPDALILLTRWWALYMTASAPDELDALGDRVEAALAALPAEEPNGEIHGGRPTSLASRSSLPWLRGLRARARGDLETLLELDDPSAIPSPSGRVEGWLAEGLLWLQRAEQAQPLIAVWLEHAEQDRYLPSTVHGLGLDALAAVESGELGRAREVSSRALGIAEDNGFDQVAQTTYARLVATWLAWVGGDLAAAELSALKLQRFWERSADVSVVVQNALLRSRIRWSLGDRLGARSLLDQATVGVLGRPVIGHFAQRILLDRAMLDLLDDEFESAERWLPDWRARLEAGVDTMRERLVLLRMSVSSGDRSSAADALLAQDDANPFHALELDRLRAIAFLEQGRVDDATEALVRSLRSADARGVMQPTLDDRRRLMTILPTACRLAGVTLPGLIGEQVSAESVYVEPLSERERTVLELMATHMSYPEMADELYISPNTVKSHVKTIFRKLAVSRRSEAVSQGRAYGLIR